MTFGHDGDVRYWCGERDVVCGARDATSWGGGAVANWQLLEVQPDKNYDGSGDVGGDEDKGGEGDEDVGVLNLIWQTPSSILLTR